jgi:DNA-binding NtrC family response regulator
MGVLTTYEPVVATSAVTARKDGTKKATRTFQCLVAAPSESRRELLLKSVNDAGWDSFVCSEPMQAWSALHRESFQMSVVDIQGQVSDDFRELCEHLATQRNMLLVICGNEAAATEEIWARQLGAWLYLPGVSVDSDLVTLCTEGRSIAERLLRSA